ncbi:carbohydrate kinase family protein [Micromonospora sp. NPDC048986]|uniref:carbohydrate kinase family protein n=1 Tax=Micromonospora sp. NPDC048986 TaxID=3155644 RepID=UPI00340B02F3
MPPANPLMSSPPEGVGVGQHIVGLAPSIVDVVARLPAETWQHCLSLIGRRPGEWRRIDAAVARALLDVIVGADASHVLLHTETDLPSDVVIRPGSTVANALSVIPPRDGLRRTFVSTVGVRGDAWDPLSEFFRTAIEAIGIAHHAVPVVGDNPVVFVLSSHAQVDRTLAMFPGVADELGDFDLGGLAPTLVLADVYNLGPHPFGRFVDRMITSKRHAVLLSLGNHTILTGGDRAQQVRRYIDDGCLVGLCGNIQEYEALYPDLGPGDDRIHRLLDRVAASVPYALVTRGADGMVATWDGHRTEVPAISLPIEEIVNTSGAGDAACGMFAAGIISGDLPARTLQRATIAAAQALRRF